MELSEVMYLLEEMKIAVIATVDEHLLPHARPIHIVAANEEGVFFMTSSTTHFYRQLIAYPQLALTTMREEDYLVQVIRIEGRARPIENKELRSIFKNNPYYQHLYKDVAGEDMHVFQLYEGKGFYHSLTQSHKYVFSIGKQLDKQICSL